VRMGGVLYNSGTRTAAAAVALELSCSLPAYH
jgi:hypothetical protein